MPPRSLWAGLAVALVGGAAADTVSFTWGGNSGATVCVVEGDTISLHWATGTHNVYELNNGNCDFSGGNVLGMIHDDAAGPQTVTYDTTGRAGTHHFACSLFSGAHCQEGFKLNVNVADSCPTPSPTTPTTHAPVSAPAPGPSPSKKKKKKKKAKKHKKKKHGL